MLWAMDGHAPDVSTPCIRVLLAARTKPALWAIEHKLA